jgi:hypothetical protein
MGDDRDVNSLHLIIDRINNAVHANSNLIKVAGTRKLDAPYRTWIRCKGQDFGFHPGDERTIQLFQGFYRGRGERYRVWHVRVRAG